MHRLAERSGFADEAALMSTFTSPGSSFLHDVSGPTNLGPTEELVYKQPQLARGQQRIIRSKKTSRLLRLEYRSTSGPRLVSSESPVLAFRPKGFRPTTIQSGCFIRSRMTAELLGIDVAPTSAKTVQVGGFIRSRRLADLVCLDC